MEVLLCAIPILVIVLSIAWNSKTTKEAQEHTEMIAAKMWHDYYNKNNQD